MPCMGLLHASAFVLIRLHPFPVVLLALLDQVCTLTGHELKAVAAAQLGAWLRQQQDLEVLPSGLEVVQVRAFILDISTQHKPGALPSGMWELGLTTLPGSVLQLHAFLRGLLAGGVMNTVYALSRSALPLKQN